MTKRLRTERHKKNPFLVDMVVPVRDKQVRVNRLDDNISLVNHSTGELKGTHLVSYKKVDGDKFVKLFAQNIGLTFDLTAAGIKSFNVLMWSVQHSAIQKDMLALDAIAREEFIEAHQGDNLKLSQPTFARGLAELERTKIIAKAPRLGCYWINPNFVFNGDRIAFTTLIEREQPAARDQRIPDLLDNLPED